MRPGRPHAASGRRRRSQAGAPPPESSAGPPRAGRRQAQPTARAPADHPARARVAGSLLRLRQCRRGAPACTKYARTRRRCTSVSGLTAILFVGDIVGAAGRRLIRSMLADLRTELSADFVVLNGENASGGIGITPKHADELFAAGADVITLGNHTYRHREVWPYLDEQKFILRPANFLKSQPGHGTCVFEREDGASLGVVNLSGNLFMQAASPAFATVDDALREVAGADHVLVDMHAEATSEKVAMGWFLDGRVTAVVGTHTHVPTADARVLPGGT